MLTADLSGDSYTQTGFDPKSTQPSSTNPFGNPPWPGWTSSNGPNWVGFLTATYNKTKIQTYNLAYGGATVDSALVAPFEPTVLSLKNQVQDQFVPIYGSHPATAPWKDSDSLFAFWIGINDVGNSWWLSNATELYDQIFTVYDGLLESIYATGARNFLFLSVPPVNLAPLTLANGDYAIENEGKMIESWNTKLKNLTTAFSNRHNDTPTIFIHDTHTLFTDVIKDPKVYEQTAGLKNTTGYCTAYEKYVSRLLAYPTTTSRRVAQMFALSCMILLRRWSRACTDSVKVARRLGTRPTPAVCTPSTSISGSTVCILHFPCTTLPLFRWSRRSVVVGRPSEQNNFLTPSTFCSVGVARSVAKSLGDQMHSVAKIGLVICDRIPLQISTQAEQFAFECASVLISKIIKSLRNPYSTHANEVAGRNAIFQTRHSENKWVRLKA